MTLNVTIVQLIIFQVSFSPILWLSLCQCGTCVMNPAIVTLSRAWPLGRHVSRVTCLISCQSMNLCNSVFRTRTPSSSSRQHQELFAITYTAAAEIWKWVSFHSFMAFIRNAQLSSAAVVFVHNIWESLGLINVSTSRNFNLFVWEQNCYSWPDHQTLLFISDPKHLLLCFEVPVDFIQLHLLCWRLVCSTMFDVCCCRLWSLEQDAEHPQPGPHIFVQQV